MRPLSTAESQSPPMTFKSLLSWLCVAVSAAFAGAGVICAFNPHSALLYLLDIFTLPVLTGAVLWLAFTLLVRQFRAAMAAGVAVLILVIALWPQAFPPQKPAANVPPVRLVFGNMWVRNGQPDRILPWLDKENPDVVAMVEANPWARDRLMEGLRRQHPYIFTRYDLVVASSWPIEGARSLDRNLPLLAMTIKAPGGDLTLAVAHLTRPWPFKNPEDQPSQFARIENELRPLDGDRFVLVGDFNTPPCAAQLHDFARRTGLHAAPALWGTWRSNLPGALRVTIDNALASSDLNLSRRRVGAFDGSDHRPIVVDIRPVK